MYFRFFLFIMILTLLGFSCSKENAPFFEENKSVENKSWNIVDTTKFTFEVKDTNTLYDFYLNLRTTANYEYSNMIVFYRLYFPNNKKLTDTAEFILAQPNGKWLGKTVSGSLVENSMLFSQKRRFPLQGKYTFAVIHGMRNQSLNHVSDVGFKIQESIDKK